MIHLSQVPHQIYAYLGKNAVQYTRGKPLPNLSTFQLYYGSDMFASRKLLKRHQNVKFQGIKAEYVYLGTDFSSTALLSFSLGHFSF